MEATKKCPYCAETIKSEAIVCRYCGRDLNRKLRSDEKLIADEQRKKGLTVGDGVRTGCGMFIVLPLIIVAIIFLIAMFGTCTH